MRIVRGLDRLELHFCFLDGMEWSFFGGNSCGWIREEGWDGEGVHPSIHLFLGKPIAAKE